jgi:hypothetical protein
MICKFKFFRIDRQRLVSSFDEGAAGSHVVRIVKSGRRSGNNNPDQIKLTTIEEEKIILKLTGSKTFEKQQKFNFDEI